MTGKRLEGCRIVIVEDEALIAMALEDVPQDAGAAIIGMAGCVADALALIEREDFDSAVLDGRLDDERVTAIADAPETIIRLRSFHHLMQRLHDTGRQRWLAQQRAMTVGAWEMLGAISRMKNKRDAPRVQGLGNGGDRFIIQSGVQKCDIEALRFDQRKCVRGGSGEPNNTGTCLLDRRLQNDGDEEFVLNDEDPSLTQQLSRHPPLSWLRTSVDHMPAAFDVQWGKSHDRT